MSETHQAAEANEQKNATMKAALGIREDYKEGMSFNQELQAAQRAQERAAREAQKAVEQEMKREREKKEAKAKKEEEAKAKKEKEKHKKRRLVLHRALVLFHHQNFLGREISTWHFQDVFNLHVVPNLFELWVY